MRWPFLVGTIVGRVQSRACVCVCVCRSKGRFWGRLCLYQTSETEQASFRGIVDHAGRDSSHRRIETMRKLQTEILRATTTCIARTRALQVANNAQSPPVECTHHAHARSAMCARETMRLFCRSGSPASVRVRFQRAGCSSFQNFEIPALLRV